FIFAPDIAEYLVIEGYSWQDAHTIAGKIILASLDKHGPIKGMSDKELKDFSPKLNCKIIADLLNPVKSVNRVKSYGGTNPKSVVKQISYWERKLK
ncbi:MAG: argininosuccinate lyase, partial [Candidatus Omnitrophica bacterium]|nr:argininosuccinate lyase [Candidatus Omnitrophota bacterium]